MAELRLIHNEYVATLYKLSKNNRWRKIGFIGNTKVAYDFVRILRTLKHKVEIIDRTIGETD